MGGWSLSANPKLFCTCWSISCFFEESIFGKEMEEVPNIQNIFKYKCSYQDASYRCACDWKWLQLYWQVVCFSLPWIWSNTKHGSGQVSLIYFCFRRCLALSTFEPPLSISTFNIVRETSMTDSKVLFWLKDLWFVSVSGGILPITWPLSLE